MTNEEAISYLENAICELDAGIKVYSGTIKEEFIEQRKCFAIALSALCEQAERDKGCDFCAADYSVMSGSRMTIDGMHKGCTAKFCPNCGRRLEAQHE